MKGPEHNGHERSLSIGNTTEAIVESQSTQLLDFVLGRTEPSHLKNGSNAQRSDVTNSSADHSTSKASVDISSQNHPSASVSPYHFHGLVSTQSPTQIVDSEDSQKENEHAQAQVQAQLPVRHSTRDTRTRTSNRAQAASKAPLTPSHVLSAEPLSTHQPPPLPPQPAKAVLSTRHASVQKGKEATKEKTPAMRFRRRPSPPIPSQDSFAGPTASQDPDLFIATSRQFDIPVDQLGQSLSQERSPVESRVAKTSVTSSDPTGINPAMDEYSLSSDSSSGRILVADSQSSNRSRGSLKDDYFSISQEPTQIIGGSSDAGTSDRVDIEEAVVEEVEVDQVPDASTRVEPSQVRSQDPTQVVEETHSIEADRSSAAESSVGPDKLTALSLVPLEKHDRYMRHFTSKSDARPEPTPGPSTSGAASAVSPAASSSTTGKRSLLDGLPPEKRARYMHHFQKDPAPVSEASHMATAGTSVGVDNPERLKSLIAPPVSEEVVDDSNRQIEIDISPAKVTKSRDHEVIPASESDVPDGSREEQEVDFELGVVEESPTTVRVGCLSYVDSSLISYQSPLAASAKGKQKIMPFASVMSRRKNSPTKPSPATSPIKPRVLASPAKIASGAVRTKAMSSRAEGAEMGPPPVPEQRLREPSRVITRAGVNNKEDKPISPFASTSAATLHRDQRLETPTILLPDSEEDSPEFPLSRLANRRREEEEESESGDAEDDEITLPEEEEKPRSRGKACLRKRKRRNPALTSKKGGKGKAAASRKATTRATSVASPPLKKARTTVAKRFGAGMGTQVFALFKQDSCFYGAEVHSLSGNRAHVKFFDGLEDPSLGIAQMRRFELRQGDIVIPGSSRAHKARVTDDSHWASENEVNAEYTEGPEEGLEFPLAADAVRIPSRAIQSHWKDRVLEVSDISPAVARKTLKDTPSPSKNSVVASGSVRAGRNRLLAKYGIIITQGPGNQNWSREKEKYIGIVRDNGGIVLSDWLDIFSLHGKHANGSKRWTIQQSDVKYTPKDKHTFDRVFLVSDVHNQKPKYLLALALGIPCVSVEWLDHLACGEEVSWSRFLLASGHSEPLGAPVSQMVDLDWGSSAEHMTEIMENPVPLKVLNGSSVLCIGPELFPQPPKKLMTDADRALEASRTVPRIILAMGADCVEAAVSAKHASQSLDQYDYVVVKESIPQPRVRGATYVDVTWIKECLIAGRLFPPTEWGV
ncbi:hypothetical protein ACEPAG_5748 [Sanghuangporus baumii]